MTCVLFDFFGTLVDHRPDPRQGYPRTYLLLREWGADVTYDEFVTAWADVAGEFERRAQDDLREFTMPGACGALLSSLLGAEPPADQVATYVDCYVGEWNAGVRHLDGVDAMLRDLAAAGHRLAVVSNTHSPVLVPAHLSALGVAGLMETVVLSVEIGLRKPHPAVYGVALDALGVTAADAVFVGDTYDADYAGPRRLGMRALLIDPEDRFGVSPQDRLESVLDVPGRL
ncbi:MAG: HAD family hydrolase [Hamadaea sp.]|nr:HAD family hydrolase [Hamadaea sp.]